MSPRLPLFTVHCRHDHEFTTRAHGGITLDCPVCRREGAGRVAVHVPKGRPRTEAEAASAGAAADDQDTAMADRWAAPAEAVEREQAEDDCPHCGDPLDWEPSRTTLVCPGCGEVTLPAVVTAPAPVTTTAVAVRPDRTAERIERLAFATEQAHALAELDEVAGVFDPQGLTDPNVIARARERWAQFAELRQQVQGAADRADLAEIGALARDVTASARLDVDSVRWDRESTVIRHAGNDRLALTAAQDDDEYDDDDDNDDDDYDEPEPDLIRTSGDPLVNVFAPMVQKLATAAAVKQARLSHNGACEFKHSFITGKIPADFSIHPRLVTPYATQAAHIDPNGPVILCCRKHWDPAIARMANLGYSDTIYLELSA
jgi:uncharacterized Zn finger protein (UPF0148 family)